MGLTYLFDAVEFQIFSAYFHYNMLHLHKKYLETIFVWGRSSLYGTNLLSDNEKHDMYCKRVKQYDGEFGY